MSSTSRPTQVAEIFYSYSHKDEALRNQLETHLASLKRSGEISEWHDRRIGAGSDWASEISDHLESAHIILLLISADFIASEYCYGIETQRAMKRHEAGEALVIPIILRSVAWEHLPFGKLQALPANAKPVKSWKNRDEAFTNIAQGLRKQLAEILPRLRSGFRTVKRSNRPKIGSLLPYLCDRSDQETALETALQYWKKHYERRPFVSIIHGDEYECHDMFRLRLKDVSLPRLLNLKGDSASIESVGLQFPAPSVTALDNVQQLFHRNLAGEIMNNRDASEEELLNAISNYTAPVLIYSHLTAERWKNTPDHLRDAFIKFWDGFRDLPPGRFVIACLFMTYKRTEKMGFLEKWSHSRLNTKTRTHLTELDFTAYGNLHGVVLPELCGIREHQVEDWLREGRNFRGLCQIHDREFCNVQGSVEAVRALYRRTEYLAFRGQIPMQLLAPDLTQLLEDHRC